MQKVEFNVRYDIIELPKLKEFQSIRNELMKLQNLIGYKAET